MMRKRNATRGRTMSIIPMSKKAIANFTLKRTRKNRFYAFFGRYSLFQNI